MTETQVGVVTHFFDRILVAAVQVTSEGLAVGDTIHIKGHTTDLTTQIESMQLEHQSVTRAEPGQTVGIRLPAKAHEHDKVFKVTP